MVAAAWGEGAARVAAALVKGERAAVARVAGVMAAAAVGARAAYEREAQRSTA